MMDTIKKTIPVTGMTCAACALSVEKILKTQKGIQQASVNYANGQALISFNPEATNFDSIRKAVKKIGYGLIINDDHQAANEAQQVAHKAMLRRLTTNTTLSIVLSVPLVILSMWPTHWPYMNYVLWVLSTPVVFIFGKGFFINAYRQMTYRMVNMDTLVALSTGTAYIFSAFNTLNGSYWMRQGMMAPVYFESAAVVISFILLGKLLEERAKEYTSGAIKKLMSLQPDTVIRTDAEGNETEIKLIDVRAGDLIVVKPGQLIPVDGMVISGSSFVNESMLTGEPIAVEKTEGAKVFTGTINQSGHFVIAAEKVGNDTMLARIIKTVQEAQGSKAPAQKLADKIAGIFVPIVLLIAAMTFIAWAIWGGEAGLTNGLLCAITTLVIACPCALGLATPTAIIAGIGKGAENGILFKDAESLELIHQVDTVVFDKTGTITEGIPNVVNMVWGVGTNPEYLGRVLYSMEMRSEHPLAGAITAFFEDLHTKQVDVLSFTSITGSGITATFERNIYFVGSTKLLQSMSIALPRLLSEKVDEWTGNGYSVVWLANQFTGLGAVAIADKIRPSAPYAVKLLQHNGIETHLLTGDNAGTAYHIAHEAGITTFKAEASPSDKYKYIEALKAEGKIVAMAGDGINDAEALATADVSIAMGTGSDIALDVARMTLLVPDLKKIPLAMLISSKTVRTVKQNLFWAFVYNIIAIPIAAGALYPINGWLINPMIAGAAMAFSSVSVVTNSLRLKVWKADR